MHDGTTLYDQWVRHKRAEGGLHPPPPPSPPPARSILQPTELGQQIRRIGDIEPRSGGHQMVGRLNWMSLP